MFYGFSVDFLTNTQTMLKSLIICNLCSCATRKGDVLFLS